MAFTVFESDWTHVYGVRRPSDGDVIASFTYVGGEVGAIEFTDPAHRKANRTRIATCDAIRDWAAAKREADRAGYLAALARTTPDGRRFLASI